MGRRSTISTHRQREAIEHALASGVPGATVARQYAVSESAISRFRISHLDATARLADTEGPDVTGVMNRLLELADDARQTRKLTALSGTPVTRARAQSTELAALEKLVSLLGITDVYAIELATASTALVRVIQRLVYDDPHLADAVLSALREHDELQELADALQTQFQEIAR